MPVVGYELTDAKDRIQAEAELGWEPLKIAVLLKADENLERFTAENWQCLVAAPEIPPAALLELLRETVS